VHQIGRLHDHARVLRRGIDLVPFLDLETGDLQGLGRRSRAFGTALALALGPAAPAPSATATTSGRRIVLRGLGRGTAAFFLGLRFEQGLPVGDRDLVVVGMNFGKGQEAVPVAAVIDERRL
jgi:hypothetical protein